MILWTGQTISELGQSMSFFVFPLVGFALTGSAPQAALAGSAYALGTVVTQLPAGTLVDRWNRRAVMCASSAAGFLLYAVLAVTLLADRLSLVGLVVVALLGGAANCFFHPAEAAAIRHVVPREQLPEAVSQNQARQYLASLVGPPLSGVLFTVARWLPFLTNMITFAVSAVALLLIRTPLPAPVRQEARAGFWREAVEGVRYLWSRGFFRAVLAFAAQVNFAAGALFTCLTLKLLQAGVHPALIGSIDAIGATAGVVGAVLAPRLMRRLPTGLMIITVGALVVMATVPMAFTNRVVVIGLLMGLAMIGLPLCNAALYAYLVTITPDALQGRVNAGMGFVASIAQPAGPAVGGVLLGLLGGRWAMLAMALLMGLAVVPLALSREVRRLSTQDTWEQSYVP